MTEATESRSRWQFVALGLVIAGAILLLLWVRFGPDSLTRPRPAPILPPVTSNPPEEDDKAIVFRPEAMKLTRGVYLLGRMPFGVAYVVEGSDGLALIDSGVDAEAAGVIEQIRELGLDLRRLRYILLTHVHGDHTLGARKLRELTGAKVCAGAGDAEVLRAGGPREAFFSTYQMDQYPIHPTPIDVELRDGDHIELGDVRIEAIATPGHTAGSTCFLLKQGTRTILFGGDTISSLRGDIGTYAAMLPPRYRGNPSKYLESLHRLRSLPTPDLVCPGHTNEARVVHGPKLTQTEWFTLLDRGIAETQEILRRFATDGADFLDGEPKELLPGLYYLGDRGQRAIYALIADGHLDVFDAPGGEGMSEFLRTAFKKLNVTAPALRAVLLTSADEDARSALPELVRETGCQVVATKDAHEAIQAACPAETRVIVASDLEPTAGLKLESRTLAGIGSAPVAYVLTWQDRRVLISGHIPLTLSSSSLERWRDDLRKGAVQPQRLFDSLRKLKDVDPNLWLPAQPSFGQNANLYAGQWQALVDSNGRLVLELNKPR